MAAASLSSRSRSAYTFNPATPAYLGSTRTVAVPEAAATLPAVTATPGAPVMLAAPVAAAPVPIATTRPVATAQVALAEVASLTPTIAQAKPAKLTPLQRLALQKVAKQPAEAETHSQHTASGAKTAAQGPGITVGIVGLATLIVGLIVSSGFLIVASSIVLTIGIALYVLSVL